MATIFQLPEGYTVRKVGNSLKVVPMRKKKVAIVQEKAMTRLINADGTPFEGEQESMEEKAARMAAVKKGNEAFAKQYFSKQAAEEAEKAHKAAAIFTNPPALSGSAKQIEWASRIRAAYIEFYKDRRREWAVEEVEAHTDAHHWIDNRYGMGVTNSDQRAIQSLIYAK
jgi:hypothetical protein